jgi:hypothetical protein
VKRPVPEFYFIPECVHPRSWRVFLPVSGVCPSQFPVRIHPRSRSVSSPFPECFIPVPGVCSSPFPVRIHPRSRRVFHPHPGVCFIPVRGVCSSPFRARVLSPSLISVLIPFVFLIFISLFLYPQTRPSLCSCILPSKCYLVIFFFFQP